MKKKRKSVRRFQPTREEERIVVPPRSGAPLRGLLVSERASAEQATAQWKWPLKALADMTFAEIVRRVDKLEREIKRLDEENWRLVLASRPVALIGYEIPDAMMEALANDPDARRVVEQETGAKFEGGPSQRFDRWAQTHPSRGPRG